MNRAYEDFVEKFKPKKTTDDCYTPEPVYQAVLDWAVERYELEGREVVRPFYPGGDYETYPYPERCVVIDNPPFSILSNICRFYNSRGIDFFLFAPGKTLLSIAGGELKYLPVGVNVIYDNGARVNTSFVTNLGENKIEVRADLWQCLDEANKARDRRKLPPTYQYPAEVLTSTRLGDLAERGHSFSLKEDEVRFIRWLDSQREKKKAIFGAGFLTKRATGEEIQELMKKKPVKKKPIVWGLSDREREIINGLK